MNWPQMQRRCPSSRFVSTARLPGFRFAIARHSRLRDCGTANIFPEPGSTVWGIVYEVSESDLLVMDGFEDGYSRQIHSVYCLASSQSLLQVIVYIAPREIEVPLPNAEYKRLVLEGARHWELPAHYCAMLDRLQAATPRADGSTRGKA